MTVTYGHLLIEPLFNFNGHVTLMLLVVAFLPRVQTGAQSITGLTGSASP